MTFIVRGSIDPEGRLHGVVTDAAQLGALITTMASQQPDSQIDLDQPHHSPGDKQ